ncbi:hypothetical protein C8R43DRAFT_1147227 [Mycena crocata]|nr:hypothetical protein C8R43DRAFT_1147227 [Mycena crocata]
MSISPSFSDLFMVDTTSTETIDADLKNIALAKNSGSTSQDAVSWLAGKIDPWLLFFDNTDDPKINLNEFFPKCKHGNIIITSQNPGLRVYAGSHSLVSDMEETHAVTLLLNSGSEENTESNREVAAEIVKRKAPPPVEDGENNTSKRVRSASVEPPPPNFPTTDLPPRPPTPPPPPKPPLHFRKKTTVDTGTDNLGNSTAGMRAEGGVIQMMNGQQYTAPPANIGFVRPQCVESPWRNTTDRNRADWGAQDGPKGWIRLYRAKYVPNARDSILKLLFVIPRLVDAPKVVISPPTAREELDERLPAPWNFLISSIPEASLKTLTNHIESNKFIARTIKEKLIEYKEATEFVVKHSSEADRKHAEAMIESIDVRSQEIAIAGGQTDIIWNVYCSPPNSLGFFRFLEWCTAARSYTFDTARFGTGVPRMGREQLFYVGCKSYDHPTGLCPLPNVPGWFGPTIKSVSSEDKTLVAGDERNERNSGKKATKGNRPGGKYGNKNEPKGGKGNRGPRYRN